MPGALHDALSGLSSGPAFAPYLWELAADRAGFTVEEMTASTSQLAAALRNACQLVEADSITLLIDESNSPTFQALERLVQTTRISDVVAVIPGPMQLAETQRIADIDDAHEMFEDLARAVLEARCDVLAVSEFSASPSAAPSFRAVAKMSEFHGARTLAIGTAALSFAVDSGFDAVDAGPEGPIPLGVRVAVASAGKPSVQASVITSSFSSRPTGSDVDWLRAAARSLKEQSKV